MKKLIVILALILTSCADSGRVMDDVKSERLKLPKYKKGDIVCVTTFNVKGIIQFKVKNFDVDDFVYSVMFVDKYDQLYNLYIYESQLTSCL
jgi:hypothetical protein